MAAGNISNAYQREFSNTIFNLVATKGGAFAGKVDERSQIGEFSNYPTLGMAVAAASSTDHGADTVIADLTHGFRVCARSPYDLALMIDKFEEVQAVANYKSPYAIRLSEALVRKRDIETIKGIFGTALTGKTGGGTAAFDYTNQVIAVGTGSTGATGMNVDKIKAVKAKFWRSGYSSQDKMYIAMTGGQISDLLGQTEVTSADYNTVRALVNGEVGQLMGIEIVQSELVPFAATDGSAELTWSATTDRPVDTDTTTTRLCVAWIKNAIIVGEAPKMEISIDKRPDKKNSWQVFGLISVGCVRLEEDGAIAVPCLEA